jgi:hypothetical protein
VADSNAGGTSASDDHLRSRAVTLDALDALIDTERKLFDSYAARVSTAETRATAALTIVVAVATLTVSAARSVQLTWLETVLAVGGYAALATTAVSALGARVRAGLQHRPDVLVTVESQRFTSAVEALRGLGDSPASGEEISSRTSAAAQEPMAIDPLDARLRVLELWRARGEDMHDMARGLDIGAGFALVVLAVGVLCLAFLGLLLLLGVGN